MLVFNSRLILNSINDGPSTSIALFIVGLLLILNTITSNRRITNIKQKHTLMYVALLVTIIQIILGTQVRENVDLLMLTLERSDVISQLSNNGQAFIPSVTNSDKISMISILCTV